MTGSSCLNCFNYPKTSQESTTEGVPGDTPGGPGMAGVEPRAILKSIESREQSEGAGARVRRAIGGASLPRLDPFLMVHPSV